MLFKESVHLWFCEHENNGASCSINGMIHEENKEIERAEKYYKKSCDYNYGIGCYKLALLIKNQNRLESHKHHHLYLSRACKLEHEKACRLINGHK
jgi:TPR repeat protein